MHGFILMTILKDYLKQNKDNISIFETGTARGFSSICMSYVLKKMLITLKLLLLILYHIIKKFIGIVLLIFGMEKFQGNNF